MRKKSYFYSIFFCVALLVASFFAASFFPNSALADAKLVGVIDGITGKEFINHVLTGYQGYSPYHYFGDSLVNSTYTKDISYINENGVLSNEYRALTNADGGFFSEDFGMGSANINLSGEMISLANTGRYYAFASAGLLALKDNERSKLSISISDGINSAKASSNKVYSSGDYAPDWVRTDKIFLSGTNPISFSFSTNQKFSLWQKSKFYIFEPTIHFGVSVDAITNVTKSQTVSRGQLISLEAKNFLSDMVGENLIRYYQNLHKIEWEIVSGAEYGQILGGYLQVGQSAGSISVRAKCLKDSFGDEYIYGDVITFNINTSTVSLSIETNFKDGIVVSGLANAYTQNRYATIFIKISDGYSLLSLIDETGAEVAYNITSQGLYRIRIYLADKSKTITVTLKKQLNIEKIVIKDKYYDKSASAEIDKIVFKEGDLDFGTTVDISNLSAEFMSTTPNQNIPISLSGNLSLVGDKAYMFEIVSGLPDCFGNILKRSIEIIADSHTIEYGNAVPNLTYQIKGDMLSGDILSGKLEVVTNGDIGEYVINLGTLGNSYYDIDFTAGTLTITQRNITIKDIYVLDKTYDGTYHINSDNIKYTTIGTFLPSHNVKILAEGSLKEKDVKSNILATINFSIYGDDAKYYNLQVQMENVFANIVPKTLLISANSAEKLYGSSDPKLTYSYDYSQLVAGDSITGELVRTRGEDVGDYIISAGSLQAQNYKIEFTSAKFVIKPRPIYICADDKSKIYGEDDAMLTYKITAGEVLAGDNLGVVLIRESGEKCGTYEIKLSSFNNNYDVIYTSGNFLINKRTAKISIVVKDKIYDGNRNCEFDWQINNAIFSDDIQLKINAKFEDKNAGIKLVKFLTVGGSEIDKFTSAVLSGNNMDCYNFVFNVSDSAEIKKKEIIASINEECLSKSFGDIDKEFSVAYQGVVSGDAIIGSLKRISGEDAGVYDIVVDDIIEENSNYKFTFNFDLKFTINKRNVKIVVDDKTIEYGAAEGEIVYYLSSTTPLPSGILLSDVVEGSPTREIGNDAKQYRYLVGSLRIKAEHEKNFELIFDGGILTIESKQVIITIKNATKIYGSSDPQFDYTLNTTEKLEISFIRQNGENVGEYEISCVINNSNFDAIINKGTLKIVPSKITIKINPIYKTYGEDDPQITYYLKSGTPKFDDSLSTIIIGDFSRELGEYVGEYQILYNNLTLSSNYDIEFEDACLTIVPRDLIIIANKIKKFYNQFEDPELTYVSVGLLENDVITGQLVREAGEGVGEYKVSLGTLAAKNYNITFYENVFVIAKRKIKVEINGVTKIYDGTSDVDLTYNLSGEILEGSEPNVTLIREVGSDVGKYLISAQVENEIYDVEIVENYFEIIKRPIKIEINSIEITYGDVIPELTYNLIGDISNSNLIIKLYRTQTNSAGEYEIYASIVNEENYDIEIVSGQLKINKRKLVISVDNYSKIYGTADPLFSYAIIDGEVLSGDIISGGITRETGEDVGEYKLICELVNSNYDFVMNAATLTIFKKDLYLVTSIKDKVYDGTDVAYFRTPLLSGILSGDEVYYDFVIDKAARYVSKEVGENIDVVVYGGVLAGEKAHNYNLIYPEGLKASITNNRLSSGDETHLFDVIANSNNTSLVEGTNIVVKDYNTTSLQKDFGNAKNVVTAFNFDLENKDKKLEQVGKITVNYELNKNELNNVQVFRLNSDGTKSLMTSSFKDGVVSFETEQSGIYIVVADNDNWINILLICAAATVLCIFVFVVVAKNKKNKNAKNAWFLIFYVIYL